MLPVPTKSIQPYLFFCLGIVLSACGGSPEEENASVSYGPSTPYVRYEANLKEGYSKNVLNNNTILPALTDAGDTIISGRSLPIEGTIIVPDSLEPFGFGTVSEPNSKILPTKTFKLLIDTIPLYNSKPIKLESQIVGDNTEIRLNGSKIKTGKPISCEVERRAVSYPREVQVSSPRLIPNTTKNIQLYDTQEGLPNPLVMECMEDSKGNLWIGMWDGGISRFDGKSFASYSLKNGMKSGIVRKIIEARDGSIWMATWSGGVCQLKGDHFNHISKDQGLGSTQTWDIIEDRDGNIWIATNSSGLVKYSNDSLTHYTVNEGLPGNSITSVFEDSKGRIWVGGRGGGISKIENGRIHQLAEVASKRTGGVLTFLEDKEGSIWCGLNGGGLLRITEEGILKYDTEEGYLDGVNDIEIGDSGEIWVATTSYGAMRIADGYAHQLSSEDGLSGNHIWTIERDRDGNFWMGTNGRGINHYYPNSFQYLGEEEGLPTGSFWSSTIDTTGTLWLGSENFGICSFDGKTIHRLSKREGLPFNFALSMITDSDGNMWVGSGGRGAIKFEGSNFVHYTAESGLGVNVIWDICEDSNGNMWFATNGGGLRKFDGEKFTKYTTDEGLVHNYVTAVIEGGDGAIWFSSWGKGISRLKGDSIVHFTEKEGLTNNTVWHFTNDSKGGLWMASDFGAMRYKDDSFIAFGTDHGLLSEKVNSIIEDDSGRVWLCTAGGLNIISTLNENEEFAFKSIAGYGGEDGLRSSSFVEKGIQIDRAGNVWMNTTNGICHVNIHTFSFGNDATDAHLSQITINDRFYDFSQLNLNDSLGFTYDSTSAFYNYPQNLVLDYQKNHLTFHYSAVDWSEPRKIQYSHKIEELDYPWSSPSHDGKADYRNIPPGSYTFKVRARGANGNWNEPVEYGFIISPPWWQTIWARIGYFIVLILLIVFIVRNRTKRLKARQKELEAQVDEATKEIREQHEEIMDSITYAKRIQSAILPPMKLIKEYLPNSFFLYKPKDVVAGDFYWLEHKNDKVFFAAADCTGHGVPGAMVSVICNNALNRTVREHQIETAGKILDKAREIVIQEFEKSEEVVKDGMDIALCVLEGMNLQFAGAHNPLWLYRNGELIDFKGDKQPIGKFERSSPFKTNEIELQSGDTIYLFSDGYADQFGGEKGKKFKSKNLKMLLSKIQDKSMDEQRELLELNFENWRGDYEQIDDVCIIGVRF